MSDEAELLAFAKTAVADAAKAIDVRDGASLRQVVGTNFGGRETKLVADAVLEEALLEKFARTGLPVLSEESGLLDTGRGDRCWVIDPLDGTVNFLRHAGPSAVSVALCRLGRPLFGVLYSLTDHELSWGGAHIGAWCAGRPIGVSTTPDAGQAVVCGGIPTRFACEDGLTVAAYFGRIASFSKVRMLGSAASALLMVAKGETDAYYEEQIMLWDVAGGVAIVEGAGGWSDLSGSDMAAPHVVFASNGLIQLGKQATS